jgi:hypothetical protein
VLGVLLSGRIDCSGAMSFWSARADLAYLCSEAEETHRNHRLPLTADTEQTSWTHRPQLANAPLQGDLGNVAIGFAVCSELQYTLIGYDTLYGWWYLHVEEIYPIVGYWLPTAGFRRHDCGQNVRHLQAILASACDDILSVPSLRRECTALPKTLTGRTAGVGVTAVGAVGATSSDAAVADIAVAVAVVADVAVAAAVTVTTNLVLTVDVADAFVASVWATVSAVADRVWSWQRV